MKQLTITKHIHPNSIELQLLSNTKMCDVINLEACKYACSDAQELILNHPRTRVILSNELKEQIAYKAKGE